MAALHPDLTKMGSYWSSIPRTTVRGFERDWIKNIFERQRKNLWMKEGLKEAEFRLCLHSHPLNGVFKLRQLLRRKRKVNAFHLIRMADSPWHLRVVCFGTASQNGKRKLLTEASCCSKSLNHQLFWDHFTSLSTIKTDELSFSSLMMTKCSPFGHHKCLCWCVRNRISYSVNNMRRQSYSFRPTINICQQFNPGEEKERVKPKYSRKKSSYNAKNKYS